MKEIERICVSPDWRRLYWRAYSRMFWAARAERRSLADDLRQEAVVKVLGPRPVPVDVEVIAALYQAIRATAGAWRQRGRKAESIETATVRSSRGTRVPVSVPTSG